ncbi:hypothetical protein CDV26_01510 [Francisella halioticida]|uniref:Uncharacterized protein n=1 Tax=Francisella halioticida TaxID=549298 RepID=A0ABM6LX63_9GAMM|nr:hypothetical protein [Francisella halioticida]ASG67238.1 hypothetical protein CDV26_01510 [Francisella halioticida]
MRIKFISNKTACLVDIKYLDREFLLFDNATVKSQERIFNLYNKVVSPTIIVTSTKLYSKFINNSLDYIIYISDRLDELQRLNKDKLKIFDTYANRAITIRVDQNSKLELLLNLKNINKKLLIDIFI